MSLDLFRGFRSFGSAGAIVSLAMVIQGCGSSSPRETSISLKGVDRAKVLTYEAIHSYEGEGKNKQRVVLGRRAQRRLLTKAAQEAAKGTAPDSN